MRDPEPTLQDLGVVLDALCDRVDRAVTALTDNDPGGAMTHLAAAGVIAGVVRNHARAAARMVAA